MRSRDLFVVLLRSMGVFLLIYLVAGLISAIDMLSDRGGRDPLRWVFLGPVACYLTFGVLLLRQAPWIAARFQWPEADGIDSGGAPSASATRVILYHVAGLAAVLSLVSPIARIVREYHGEVASLVTLNRWRLTAEPLLYGVIAVAAFTLARREARKSAP